jgi:hypothetical protein
MSMIGCLKRATDGQIAQLLENPQLIRPFLYGEAASQFVSQRVGCLGRLLGMKPPKPEPLAPLPEDWPAAEEGDEMDVEKAWHGLHYLLTGSDWEGEEPLCFLVTGGQEIGDIDVGYGPARALTSGQVRNWAEALAGISEEQLRERFDPVRMSELDIYPSIWNEGGERSSTTCCTASGRSRASSRRPRSRARRWWCGCVEGG